MKRSNRRRLLLSSDIRGVPVTDLPLLDPADLEVVVQGAGRPILLLHGFQNLAPNAAFLSLLAKHGELIAPSHPGFGRSPRPDGFDSMYDLVLLYLQFIERLGRDHVTVIGLSFGAWIAAELAVHQCCRMQRLVLIDAVGIKISDRETPDIFDVFNTSPAEVLRRSWHDPRKAPNFATMPEEDLVLYARNREALCRYGWNPYLHNPRLKDWLPHIKKETLMLWGASDGIVAESIWPTLRCPDPGHALRGDRGSRAPSGDRAA